MKKLIIISLIALSVTPCIADEKEHDWETKAIETQSEKWKAEPQIVEKIKSYHFLSDALKMMQTADTISVFEGMPHQYQEAELLKQELAKTEELVIATFAFYPEPRELLKTDRPALNKLLDKSNGFHIYGGPKLCGGYHPDFAIRFKSGNQTCDLLLCFGCDEARIHLGHKVITCDISRDVWKELLSGYAKLRPKSE